MRKIFFSIILALVFALNVSCSQALGQFVNPVNSTSDANLLTIDQVSESDGPGQFLLAGKANLPEQTPLTVSAIRQLILPSDNRSNDNDLRYGILDRKTTLVRDARWQVKLSLWEVNSEGYYQENWQQGKGSIATAFQPSPRVDFFLTVEPQDFAQVAPKLRSQRLESQVKDLRRFTPEGEPYLSTGTALAIPLPQNIKSSALETVQKSVGTWEGRATLDKTRSSIESPTEIPFLKEDNLLISPENMMK
ncbi:MAG TPA: hypothetical protein IGR64_12025 [Leptolyngbyaceae cyanobacterium M65_K2018_010]|nr:hypothetical protein [Leptolyngbyaceae cyanobacterium M65_K2018_010]